MPFASTQGQVWRTDLTTVRWRSSRRESDTTNWCNCRTHPVNPPIIRCLLITNILGPTQGAPGAEAHLAGESLLFFDTTIVRRKELTALDESLGVPLGRCPI